jgi:hypothetical protein
MCFPLFPVIFKHQVDADCKPGHAAMGLINIITAVINI